MNARTGWKRRIATPLLALLLAGVQLLGAVGVALAQQQEVVFGLAMPLTGSQALYGADQVQAALWAVEDINAAGGVNGKPMRAIVLDTQANPQLGINAVNRLVSVDQVPVFITAWSAVVSAIAPIANRNEVLALSVGANSPQIAQLGDYVYTTYPLADVDIAAVARYSYEVLGKRRAAVLYVNNDTGVHAAQVYRDVFQSLGGQIVAFEGYAPTATDYTGVLLQIRRANPDVIHLQGLVSDTPQVIAQMRQLGIQTLVTSYSAAYNVQLIEQLGPAAEGVIATALAPDAELSPKVKEYVDRWVREIGRVPNGLPYTQYLYDAPYIIKALYEWVEAQGLPATGPNMRRALVEIGTFELPLTGTVTINPDHTVRTPVYLMQVQNGRFVHIATVR